MENIKTYLQNTANFQVIEQKCKNDWHNIKFYVKNNEILYIEYDCEMYCYQLNDHEYGIRVQDEDLKSEYYNVNQTKKLEVEYSKVKDCLYVTVYSNFGNEDLILTLQL